MDPTSSAEVEDLTILNVRGLSHIVMEALFGEKTESNIAKQRLKESYLAFNEASNQWQLLERNQYNPETHSHVREIEGIVCGDQQIYLVVRSKLELDTQKNKSLAYLTNWLPDLIPPKKEQRAIRL